MGEHIYIKALFYVDNEVNCYQADVMSQHKMADLLWTQEPHVHFHS